MITIRSSCAALGALLLAGCAVESQEAKSLTTGSLKPKTAAPARPAGRSSEEQLKAFCAQRHVDYQAGKAPGGAKSIEQKQADDRLCEGIGRQG